MSGRKGFTLLETLVAAAILTLVAAMVFGSFNSVSSASKGVEERSELYHTARFIIRKISQDLGSASLLPNNENGRFVGEDSGGNEEQADKLTFTGFGRRILFANAGSDQALITWYVLSGSEKKRQVLMRSENPIITSPELTEEKSENLDVTNNLRSFNVRYLTNGEWVDTYDSERAKKLPEAVQVEFALEDDNGNMVSKTALITIGGRA